MIGDVRVQFLGCGDAFGSGARFQTCIDVQAPDIHFLIDCGASSLIAMKRFGVDPADIDVILITHLHGDHFGGIPFYLLDVQFMSKRTKPLTIAGPPGIAAHIRNAQEVLFPGAPTNCHRFDLRYQELDAEVPQRVGPLEVTPYVVEHVAGAPPFALRVGCDGKTIVYSGDTEWTDALVPASAGADLFVCECSGYDRRVVYHLDFATLSEHLDELTCKRLVLTHMNPDMLARVDDLGVEVAEDGKVVTI